MIETKRKDSEAIGAFLRRFSRKVQQSGVLVRARKIRFKADTETRREKQLAATRRAANFKAREKLFKLGKLDSGK